MKQGCPLSGNLFLLVVEVLALKIRQNQKIKGIKIDDTVKTLSQYADDLWTSTEFDRQSFNGLKYEFQQFQRFSGLNINYNKTEILRIGALRKTDAQFYSELPLQWSDGPFKILGIDITADLQETANLNYKKKTRKSRKHV